MAKFENKNGGLLIDGKPVILGYESFSGWFWFATEVSEERKKGSETGGSMINGKELDDTIYYGLVQGHEDEWGYFSKAEIESMSPMTWKIKPQDLPYAGRRNQ